MASDLLASITGATPARTIWKASAIAWINEAQTLDTAKVGPRGP
jgi:hypothetical protein